MPNRTGLGAPKGLLPKILAEAGKLAESQQRMTMTLLDEMTDSTDQPPLGGGKRLTRADYLVLLANDEAFQEKIMSKLPFATVAEREKLKRDLQRLLPESVPLDVPQAAQIAQQAQAAQAAQQLQQAAPIAEPNVDGSLPFTSPVPAPLPGEGGYDPLVG